MAFLKIKNLKSGLVNDLEGQNFPASHKNLHNADKEP